MFAIHDNAFTTYSSAEPIIDSGLKFQTSGYISTIQEPGS